MRKYGLLILLAVVVVSLGCDERTQQTDSGGVILEAEFAATNVPFRFSVNGDVADFQAAVAGTLTITSIVPNIENSATSSLMDVELEGVEFTYTRVDRGTRVPSPFFFNLLGTVPTGGTLTYNGMPILSIEQISNPPISDLLFENGGYDKETGETVVSMNVWVRAYGRTVSGREVQSTPRPHTVEFTQ